MNSKKKVIVWRYPLNTYTKHHSSNKHKMIPIPVCRVKKDLEGPE